MTQNFLLLRFATFFSLILSSHILAVEVQQAEITEREDGMLRSYTLITDGKPDARFKFTAHRVSETRWDLEIMPTDTFNWAVDLSFKEYTEVIYHCVDRFIADVPDGKVWSIHMCITRNSQTWQDMRKELVSNMKKRTGPAVAFSALDHGEAGRALLLSPEIKELGQHLATHLKRKFDFSILDMDYLVMRVVTREDSERTWQDIAKLPDLALDMKSLKFTLEFKPIGKTDEK